MTSLYLLAFLIGLWTCHVSAVVELTDQNFWDYAKTKDVLLVDFYAPWCSDCKALDPDFESAASTLGTRSLDLAKVDCFGAGKATCDGFGIKRWPTLKNFNRGQFTGDYEGSLAAADIVGYITNVENSITSSPSNMNPFAMVAPQPIQQACMSRCSIEKLPTKKHRCMARCKTSPSPQHNGHKKVAAVKLVQVQPVINQKSCAKCKIPQATGKNTHCSKRMKKACAKQHFTRAGLRTHKHKTDMTLHTNDRTATKKTEVTTLTSASNDNVLKLALEEPLIIPPNAGAEKKTSVEGTSEILVTPTKVELGEHGERSVVEEIPEDVQKPSLQRIKTSDLTPRETLKLVVEADDKKTPVIDIPSQTKINDKKINADVRRARLKLPNHDSKNVTVKSGKVTDKTSLKISELKEKVSENMTKKSDKQVVVKTTPRIEENHSKLTTTKVAHDSGVKNTKMRLKFHHENVNYPLPKLPSVSLKTAKLADLFTKTAKLVAHAHAPNAMQSKSTTEFPSPNNDNICQLKSKTPTNEEHDCKNNPVLSDKSSVQSSDGDIPSIPWTTSRKITLTNLNSEKKSQENIEKMSPYEAMKVPYDPEDRK